MTIKKSEKISFYSHLAGVGAAIIGTAFLIYLARTNFSYLLVSLIYCFSVILLFSASSIYHANKKAENETTLWRKLDHLAIFLMIAGTYTPVCYIYLTGKMKIFVIGIQWVLVFLGLVFKLYFINAPRFINTIIYLFMGSIVIIPLRELLMNLPQNTIIYMVLGCIIYISGALIYATKKPDIKWKGFGFHEIFHFFIILASVFHYFMVYSSVKAAII